MKLQITTQFTDIDAIRIDFDCDYPVNSDITIEWNLELSKEGDRLYYKVNLTKVTGCIMLENGEELEPRSWSMVEDGGRYDIERDACYFTPLSIHVDSNLEFQIAF